MNDDPFALLPVAVLRTRAGVVVTANHAATTLFGTAPGRPFADAFPPPAHDEVAALLGAPDGQPREIHLRSGLELLVAECRAATDGDDVVVTAHDVTERRRLSAVIDSMFVICNLLDTGANVVWQSEATRHFYDTWGLTADEVRDTSLFDWTHPEDIPAMLELLGAAMRGDTSRGTWSTRWRPPGHEQWYESDQMGAVAFDHPDLGGIVHVQLHKEEVDVDAERDTDAWRFHTLAEAAPVGILVGRLDGDIAYCNGLAERLLGTFDRGPGGWLAALRPEHRDDAMRAWVAALTGTSGRTVAAIAGDAAEPRWVNVNVVPQCDAAGNPVGVIATIEDITDAVDARRDAERVLQVLDMGHAFVLITDGRGRVLHANRSAEERLGIRHSITPGDALTGHFAHRFVDHVLPALESTGQWRGELELRGVDGTPIPVHAVARAEISGDGRIESIAFVGNDISELKEVEEQLRRLATHDILTGLPNRSLLLERIGAALAGDRPAGSSVALLFCDLDGFKQVNDSEGHEAGDIVLRTVAERLLQVTRGADIAARLGGDEFVVLCVYEGPFSALEEIAARIADLLPAPIRVSLNRTVSVGVSVGIAVADERTDDPEQLLDRADREMYEQKRRRKGA